MSLGKEALRGILKAYEEAYYSGESVVSDEEYDGLKDLYVEMYGEYDFVPGEGNTEFEKVKHLYPLKSLEKVQLNDPDLKEKVRKMLPLVIQPKFDGLSIEITKVNGKLKFVTRGNGEEGDDVTAQCMQIEGIEELLNLFDNEEQSFRAEILMFHSDFEKLNKQRAEDGLELFKNCRNAAAGMLRNTNDLSKINGLTIMLYEDLSSIDTQTNVICYMQNKLKNPESNILISPTFLYIDDEEYLEKAIKKLHSLEEFRTEIDYDIDGWVIKSNKYNSLELFGGYTGHHPKNAFAVKGEAKGEWTKIKSITWQVGKENITPVAELEPVEITGSTIERATLHNVSFLKAIGLTSLEYKDKYGTQPLTMVRVVKANDVIPRIIEVKNPENEDNAHSYSNIIHPPSKCPVCGAPTAIKDTESDSEILICTGNNCPAKMQRKMELMSSREAFNITGLSEGTIAKIIDTFDLESYRDVLLMNKEDILKLDGFAEKSADKLEKAIYKARETQPIDKVLYASCIPLIGRDACKKIFEYYTIKEFEEILEKDEEDALKDLTAIPTIGEKMAKSLYDNKIEYYYTSEYIYRMTDIKKEDKKEVKNQKTFCITGQREPFKTIIEEAGHKVTGSVSKKTDALVCYIPDEEDTPDRKKSSKEKNAEKLGIKILRTEPALRNYINGIDCGFMFK
jgi:DNA ligase (NAD+)